MSFGYLFGKFFVLLIFLVIGFIACKTKVIDAETNKRFTGIILNIASPALVLAAAFNSEIELALGDVFLLLGASCLFYLLMFILAMAVAWIFGKELSVRGVYKFMVVFGNVAFMGYPVIAAIFGSSAVVLASICNMPNNFLVFSIGLMLVTGTKDIHAFDWKLLINAPLIGAIIALIVIFADIKMPSYICEAADYLGNMVVPSSLIIIGASLGNASFKEIFGDWRAYVLSFIKLIISPIIIYFIFRLFIKDQLYLGVLTILAAMPVATLTPMISVQYGGDTLAASRGVFISTIFSIITIPVLTMLLFA